MFIIILLTVAIIAAVFFVVPPAEGLGFLVRIIYFHVPTAWLAVIAFFTNAFFAAKYLKRRNLSDDLMSSYAAKIGFISVILSTISGAIFSKLTWGAYWNWDPRQTTIFVLILIYGAYLTLRLSVNDIKIRAKVSAIYSLLSIMTVPFLMFILPRMYFSLHPSIINSNGIDMDQTMLIVLIAALFDVTLIFIYLMRKKIDSQN
ncbi:MAG: cytochrome c biogenesis protein CcsA [Selenomonadaceae bacterium]|nr:cytochrome c biogenesis protein CcsA [Selenomonadaceae bacterium]